MPMHPHAQPNFRNLFWYPFKVTMITALRTFPIIGKRFSWGYHNTLAPQVLDEGSKARVEANVEFNDVSKHAHQYAADREAEGPVHAAHPLSVSLGEVVVHRDDVHSG